MGIFIILVLLILKLLLPISDKVHQPKTKGVLAVASLFPKQLSADGSTYLGWHRLFTLPGTILTFIPDWDRH